MAGSSHILPPPPPHIFSLDLALELEAKWEGKHMKQKWKDISK
jgi:hypothetical protein